MELFKILGTVAINIDEAIAGIDKVTDMAEKSRHKTAQAFGKIGDVAIKTGKVVASGLAIGATAMAGLATKALKLGGELEQNMGGSAAVFGSYAEKMQKEAKDAYGNMGLSASDYLATANKMGALFKGAGFSIKTSVDMTTQSMQRAADVASIMGIDTASAMDAIAGAAKGNFTMMDNLGVAMNDTALGAYALSKGIKKNVSDMSQQEKIGLAMEMFLEKTAYAAGNYAKENETLAGSLATAKAAFSNFLSGAGDANSLVDALVRAGDVIIANIQVMLPRLVQGLNILADQLLPHIPIIIEALLPGIIEGAVALMTGLAAMLPEIILILIDALPGVIAQIRDALLQLFPQLEEPFNMLADAFSVVIDCFWKVTDWIVANKEGLEDIGIIVGSFAAAWGLVNGAITIWNAIGGVATAVTTAFGAAVTFLTSPVGAVVLCIAALIAVIAVLVKNWDKVKEAAVGVWEGIKSVWGTASDWFKTKIVQPVTNLFTNLGNSLKEAFKKPINWVIDGINTFIRGINQIKIPDWVPVVGGNGFNIKEIPQLEKGGILAKGQVGLLEGNGAEAVVPLDRNQAWISAVARDMKSVGIGGQSDVLEQYFQKLIEMLSDYFPQIVNGMDRPIEFNPNSMAAALAVPMNQELGRISARKDRGR